MIYRAQHGAAVARGASAGMRITMTAAVLFATAAAPCLAAPPAFVAPAGWRANPPDQNAPATASPVMQWHVPGDTTTSLTFLHTSQSYDDSLGAIHTNLATNKIKPAVDKDLPCQGKTAHVVEFTVGPDAHKIVMNRLLVPMLDGVAAITYSHEDGSKPDPDVVKAESDYCAASGT